MVRFMPICVLEIMDLGVIAADEDETNASIIWGITLCIDLKSIGKFKKYRVLVRFRITISCISYFSPGSLLLLCHVWPACYHSVCQHRHCDL